MDSENLLRRARAHLAAGNAAQAALIANVYVLEVEPKEPEAHRIIAQAAQLGGNLQLAAVQAARVAILEPENATNRGFLFNTLNHLAVAGGKAPEIARGARALVDRMRLDRPPGDGPAPAWTARSIDLVASMREANGSELNLIETARRLRRHLPVRLWSDRPPHPRLIALDPTIEVLSPRNLPTGDTLAIMATYGDVGPWVRQIRARRIIVHFNIFDLSDLLRWMGGLNGLPAETIDLLYPSRATRDAIAIDGAALPSPIDLETFSPRRQIERVAVVGRFSNDSEIKHHPHDPTLYIALMDEGLGVRIMGGHHIMPFLPKRDRLTITAAHTMPARAFLDELDLFLYRTGTAFETWGRVISEAMACGLPVVCHPSGGYAEIIRDGENGFFFTTNEQALALIGELRDDAPRLKRVGEVARQTIIDLQSPAAEERMVRYFVGGG
jgi:glycosyltransferase involved in cell wall biosynthesis